MSTPILYPLVRPAGGFSASCLLAVLLLAFSPARSQTISYLFPDVGSPGMNTSVEFVAPVDAPGSFGSDGLYLNNPGDRVRIVCDNPADTAKVTIGPLIVSWNGRLISTQIFVDPAADPNSNDWTLLRPEFIIPLRVQVDGNLSNIDYFYIVQPLPTIVASGGGLLGEGALGKRSRRGAMIVEGMELGAGTYRVSVSDCDAATPGNQAYLPFVLISKGPVTGQPGAELSVSSPGKQAGAGGGGGGGNFCDWSPPGSDGGPGFTGGGRGGRNRSGNPFSTDEFRNPGESTGGIIANTGASLNGVLGGTAPGYEAAGGGTGHPFGSSGIGCLDGNTCNPFGAAGGGSGASQSLGGGGGGYATTGGASSGSATNGGQVHGNRQLVPFAGGSGGAGGNPQGVGVCSGEGGGGGGAILVSAPAITNLQITANGGTGQSRPNGPGGGGSGGAVAIEVRNMFSAGIVSAAGGAGGPSGGSGRIRRDGQWNSIPINPPTVSNYTGPSTDTSHFVPKTFTLTGTGNGERIDLYLRSHSMPWSLIGSVAGVTWSFGITLPGADEVYYLVAAQQVSNPQQSNQFLSEPAWVLSQAAANVLVFRSLPVIAGESELTFSDLGCEDGRTDTVMVHNLGESPLVLQAARWALGTEGFTMLSPFLPATVNRRDSVGIVVRIFPRRLGPAVDTLLILNNDTAVARNPWRIVFRAYKDSIGLAVRETDLDFGTVLLCERAYVDTVLTVDNVGTLPIRIALPTIGMGDVSVISPPPAAFPVTIAPGATLQIRLRYQPTTPGSSASGQVMVVIDSVACDRLTSVRLSGRAETAAFALSSSNLDFDTLRCPGEFTERDIVVTSTGTLDLTLGNPSLSNPRFVIVSPPLPVVVPPGTQVTVRVRFVSGAPGTEIGALQLSAMPCSLPFTVTLVGRQESISLAAAGLDFGMLQSADFPVVRTVTVRNSGTAPVTVTQASFDAGVPFEVLGGVPVLLAPGDSALISVRFNDPGSDGPSLDSLRFITEPPSCALAVVSVRGARGTAAITLEIDTASAAPGEIVDIPIFLRASTNPTLFGATGVQTTLRYNKHLLQPLFTPAGSFDGNDRVIPLVLPLSAASGNVLAVLRFRAMLGMAESTVLGIDSSAGIGGALAITEIPGAFTLLGICREGGTRLFDGSVPVSLAQNRPNPFNPVTEIEYTLVEEGPTTLFVLDNLGRRVAVLADGVRSPGTYTARFDASGLPSGAYTCVLQTPTVMRIRRMAVVK